MTKTELRHKYKLLRQSLTEKQRDDLSLLVANQLLKLDIWEKSFYHIFLTIAEQNELNTDYILTTLSGKDKNIVLSKSNFEDYSMVHYLLTDNTKLKKNSYNIPEPVEGIEIKTSEIEVIFIPLLAFDKTGNRIGYGKGFYDRFLRECQPKTLKIGLSFFEAEKTQIDASDKDVRLDYCVTPHKIYKF
jgi:5-formyltetrahydrofolate cyclo-ligase